MPYSNIDSPKKYFDTKLYTGTGATNSVGGLSFKPDLTWIKTRNSGADWHRLIDAVRGVTKELYSNATNAESTQAQSLQTFNSDGFTLGTLAEVNANGNTFVSWNFLGANTTTSNTSGSITSTVSANTTSGFSVVSYTGNGSTNQTVGHGLGATPDFIIVKARSTTMNWPTYLKTLGNGVAFLDVTDAWNGGAGYTNYWYTTGMTSSTFGISNNVNTNTSSATYIAYCFSAIKGFSKFSTYVGNGSANGTFVYTGFKPAFLIIKRNLNATNWLLFDNKRDPYNVMYKIISPNTSSAEATADPTVTNVDFLSNGFKLPTTWDGVNGSGSTYLYMCFAENPFCSSKGIPTTAR